MGQIMPAKLLRERYQQNAQEAGVMYESLYLLFCQLTMR